MQTSTTEDYLKAIFKLSGPFKKGVSTNSVAEELSTKASSVSDMVKKLAEKKISSLYQISRNNTNSRRRENCPTCNTKT